MCSRRIAGSCIPTRRASSCLACAGATGRGQLSVPQPMGLFLRVDSMHHLGGLTDLPRLGRRLHGPWPRRTLLRDPRTRMASIGRLDGLSAFRDGPTHHADRLQARFFRSRRKVVVLHGKHTPGSRRCGCSRSLIAKSCIGRRAGPCPSTSQCFDAAARLRRVRGQHRETRPPDVAAAPPRCGAARPARPSVR